MDSPDPPAPAAKLRTLYGETDDGLVGAVGAAIGVPVGLAGGGTPPGYR